LQARRASRKLTGKPRRRLAMIQRLEGRSALIWPVLVGTWLVAAHPARGEDPMVFPGRDWAVATPESQGVDPERLAEAVRYLEAHSGPDGARQLVIVRRGYLIWSGDDIDNVHGIWSCTKSFTSTVLGLLVDDGKCGLDTRAAEHVPALAGTYGDVTLRHFATMTSGYRARGDEPQGGYTHGPSDTPFDPDPQPLFTPPGSRFAYWDSAMNEFGLVLTRIAGEPMRELFRHRIAEPIGMDPERWRWGDFGAIDGITVNSGSGNHGRSVHISARELARLGHLFLNRGRWGGRPLISARWVEAASGVQVPATLPLGHRASGIDGRGVYGLNWWVNGVKPDGARKWPGAPAGTYASSGFNNNDMFIIPEWGMVVVRLGLDEGEREIKDEEYGEFLRLIGQALGEGG
jgi:CubicO group peptidase (beta-lactamase class C family)